METNGNRISTAVWRQVDPLALELATIDRTGSGFVLRGDIVVADEPMHVCYAVFVDNDWKTKAAGIVVHPGHESSRKAHLRRDPDSGWRAIHVAPSSRDEMALPQFDGLVDIDLGCTPATNLLPIHRFNLKIGESAETTAVWVQVPSLEISRLPQRYTRLSEREYRYESVLSGFSAVLEVDSFGVVDRYNGIWERLNRTSSPGPGF